MRHTETQNCTLREALSEIEKAINATQPPETVDEQALQEIHTTCQQLLQNSTDSLSFLHGAQQAVVDSRRENDRLKQLLDDTRRQLDAATLLHEQERRDMSKHMVNMEQQFDELRQVTERQQIDISVLTFKLKEAQKQLEEIHEPSSGEGEQHPLSIQPLPEDRIFENITVAQCHSSPAIVQYSMASPFGSECGSEVSA